jgi:hypothetical protein
MPTGACTPISARWQQPGFNQNGSYIAHAPISVPNPGHLLPELRAMIGPSGCALIGFDFPIGLPHPIRKKLVSRTSLCPCPTSNRVSGKISITSLRHPPDISLHRPFYPARPGNASQSHLLAALGFQPHEFATSGLRARLSGRRPLLRSSGHSEGSRLARLLSVDGETHSLLH